MSRAPRSKLDRVSQSLTLLKRSRTRHDVERSSVACRPLQSEVLQSTAGPVCTLSRSLTMTGALTPSCTFGSPQRKLNTRQQAAKGSWRHQHTYTVSSEGHTWITKTLHQLHSSTSTRAALTSPCRQLTLCSTCRTPLASTHVTACGPPLSFLHKRIRPGSSCYSLAPARQTSIGGGNDNPPSGNNGGGGGGDGSNNPFGHDHQHHESPVTGEPRVQGLEDILLLDVQGQLLNGIGIWASQCKWASQCELANKADNCCGHCLVLNGGHLLRRDEMRWLCQSS